MKQQHAFCQKCNQFFFFSKRHTHFVFRELGNARHAACEVPRSLFLLQQVSVGASRSILSYVVQGELDVLVPIFCKDKKERMERCAKRIRKKEKVKGKERYPSGESALVMETEIEPSSSSTWSRSEFCTGCI